MHVQSYQGSGQTATDQPIHLFVTQGGGGRCALISTEAAPLSFQKELGMSPRGGDTWILEKAVDSLHGVATLAPLLYTPPVLKTQVSSVLGHGRHVPSVRISEGCV